MDCNFNENSGFRKDPIIRHEEMNYIDLEETLHNIYVKTNFSKPIVASLKYVPDSKYLNPQFNEDYLKLEELAQNYCDEFVYEVIGNYSFLKDKEFIVLSRNNHYTRPVLPEEKLIDSKLHSPDFKPYTSGRLSKAVFSMIVLNEQIPCECNIDNFVTSLDKLSNVYRLNNRIENVSGTVVDQENMGYKFYHVTPDEINYLNMHKSGIGFNREDLMPLVLGRSIYRVPLEISHDVIKSALIIDTDKINPLYNISRN